MKNNYWNVHVNNINIILFLKETINYNKVNKIFILKLLCGKNLTIFLKCMMKRLRNTDPKQ